MFDFSHLPQNAVVSEYPAMAGSTSGYRTWHKPPNCRLVFMFAIGAGGGGGGGGTGSNIAGGGGGGSASMSQVLYLASEIPNTLLIRMADAAAGAVGGSPGGGAGGVSASVSVRNYPGFTNPQNSLIGATGGTSSGGSTAGSAGLVVQVGDNPLQQKSIYFTSTVGRPGQASSSGSNGNNTSISTASPILGGASGGGTASGINFFGGTFASDIPFVVPSIPASTIGINGSQGYGLPFLSIGGCGGAVGNVSNGANGGNATTYGAGGGGGGASSILGGRGGNGGPAYICIIAW